MPANLTPEYLEAEKLFKEASTPEEKLVALKRMLTTIPKHKGTDRLQGDIKKRIAKMRQLVETRTRKKGFSITVEREGAGQVAVVGPPNSGKSQLVRELSGVDVEVAPYPYTTQQPAPAMMPYEDILIQLVDLPPVCSTHTETWLPQIVRTTDAAVLVVDLGSEEVLDEIEDALTVLEDRKVRLVGGEPASDAWASVVEKKTLLVGAKVDLPGAEETWSALSDLYGERFKGLPVSTETLENVEEVRSRIFGMLRLVRVYSKPPHHEADRSRPFVLGVGSTLLDFARTVHHDFEDKLKFARVWGHGKFEGQRINKDYTLVDGDVIELHV